MTYTFNKTLANNLFGILNTNAYAMSKRMGMSVDTLRRHLSGKQDCRADILIAVCNEYHLDISTFFLSDGEEECSRPVLVEQARWSPVVFHHEILGQGGERTYTCAKLASLCSELDLDIMDVLRQNLLPQSQEDSHRHYYFKELFQLLPTLLKVSHRQIGIDTGHTIHTYGAAVKSGDILMRTLVDVCNAYRIPINLFFPREGCMTIPDEIRVPGLDEQEFHPYRIMEFYGNEDIFMYELREKINLSAQRMIRYMSKTSPMKATELVDISNRLGVSPMYFLENPAVHVASIDQEKINMRIRGLKNEADMARKESMLLKSRLRHMESMENMRDYTKKVLEK